MIGKCLRIRPRFFSLAEKDEEEEEEEEKEKEKEADEEKEVPGRRSETNQTN